MNKDFQKPNNYNVVIFDCDSTLTKIEGVDELAKIKRKKEQIALLTKLTQEGKMLFNKALSERLKMIRPTKNDLDWLGRQYIKNAVPGAKKLIAKLKKQGVKTYIISGGYLQAVKIFAKYLGVPKTNVFAINLKFNKNGKYLDFDKKNPLTKNGGKQYIVRKLTKHGKTMLVGDGVTDLETKSVVDLFIGFGGVVKRRIVKKNADVFITNLLDIPKLCFAIETSNLLPILKIVQKGRKIC